MIHVSGDLQSTEKKRHVDAAKAAEQTTQLSGTESNGQQLTPQIIPSRRFHISRSMLKKEAAKKTARSGVSKKPKTGPAIFVEKTRKKTVPKQTNDRRVASTATTSSALSHTGTPEPESTDGTHTTRSLKKPGAASRIRVSKDATTRAPLPEMLASHHEEDMKKIADDLNKWVIDEIGANLESMEQEKRQTKPTSPFRPKAPAQRYRERHPQAMAGTDVTPISSAMDTDEHHASDATEDEEDDDDWVIEEYIRIPVKAMAQDVLPTDVGVLVLDGDEATALFYGPENDSDDDFAEDDEDENGKSTLAAPPPGAALSTNGRVLTGNCSREPLHSRLSRGRGRL